MNPNILALREANLEGWIDSRKFPVRSYLFSIRKDFITDIYGLAVYVKEELPFAQDLY